MDVKDAVTEYRKTEAAHKRAKATATAKEKLFKAAKSAVMSTLESSGHIWKDKKNTFELVEKEEAKVVDHAKLCRELAALEMWECFSIKTTPIREALDTGALGKNEHRRIAKLLDMVPITKLSVTKAR